MRIGTIDVGSNAARLLIVDVIVNKEGIAEFNKVDFIRIPLRLGFDVFEMGAISKHKIEKMIEAMKAFRSLLSFYDVKAVKACATSALREAENNEEIVEMIENETGIDLEIISGSREASLISETHIVDHLDKEHNYLYIDVGGGSTELTYFESRILNFRKSFPIGTIRILKNQINEKHWGRFKSDIKANIKSGLPLVAIGSGGNINKVFSLSKKKEDKPLSLDNLKEYHKKLSRLSVEERIHDYKLKEDRADVIVPALEIYIHIMQWASIDKIFVPKIGLVDALAHVLYEEIHHAGEKKKRVIHKRFSRK